MASARWRFRWKRALGVAVGAYVGLVVVVTLTLHIGVLAARSLGHGPPQPHESLPPINHLRVVDDKLLAGAQTRSAHYRTLAEMGVTVIVDMRTGAADDPNRDDPAALKAMGLEYVSLPVPDGHAPSPATVERFLDVMEAAEGRVFLHCGGGVGRSTTMEAAYEASRGREPSWANKLAIGPPTLQQLWFTATAGPGRAAPHNGLVRTISEVIDAPRRGFSRLRARL